jgi:hypothetical protein
MGLDIRYPIGMMFSLIGAMMVIMGIITGSKPGMYDCSLGININLIWGSVLLVFGVLMFALALRAQTKDRKTAKQ